MEFEKKILSREIQQFLYGSGLTVGSAESCTGGRIAESIIAVPGASTYFKGGVISYTNEVKENLLGVDHNLLEEKTAVCEEVAKEMVKGAIKALNVDFAIASTGTAGPGGGTAAIPVGTIWLACGNAENIVTMKLTEDYGRDINLAIATSKALQMFIGYLKENMPKAKEEGVALAISCDGVGRCALCAFQAQKLVKISTIAHKMRLKTKKTLNTQLYLKECFAVSKKVVNFAPCLE